MAEFMRHMYPAFSRRATQVCIMSAALERIALGAEDAQTIARAALEHANPFDWIARAALAQRNGSGGMTVTNTDVFAEMDRRNPRWNALASPAEAAQPELWTQCIFTGDPPPEYADWHAFINAPVKSGVTVTATGITAEPPMEQKKENRG
jgi:hypothetical protein